MLLGRPNFLIPAADSSLAEAFDDARAESDGMTVVGLGQRGDERVLLGEPCLGVCP